MTSQLSVVTYKARREDLVLIKSVLEGYDNLAIMTTLDPVNGIFEIRVPCAVLSDIKDLMHQLGTETSIEIIESNE